MDLGLRVLSYLISGVLIYGLLGWLGDHYFGHQVPCCRSALSLARPSGCT